MTDLNKRIAIIAGWTGIEVFTPAKSGLRGHIIRDGQHMPPRNIPDFLASESLHLLVELANKKFESYEMYKYSDGLFWVRFRPLGATDKSFNWSGKPVTSLSEALAAAIIKAAE